MIQQTTWLIANLLFVVTTVEAHDGPDPLAHWRFNSAAMSESTLKARLGPDVKLTGEPSIVKDDLGESLLFKGGAGIIAKDYRKAQQFLPKQSLTVAAWVAVNEPQRWGGIVGTIEDDGDLERGWILGYNDSTFSFALASTGADDGDGKLTYLDGKTKYEVGRLYHVVGVYDGTTMELYVNGKLDGTSGEQSGDILYPQSAPFVIAAYQDANEFHPLKGRLREISIYDLAAKAAWVSHEFEHGKQLAALPPYFDAKDQAFVVKPYLQYGTQTGMTVMWQTALPSSTELFYGETSECEQKLTGKPGRIHEQRIEDLKPETQYFYRTESKMEDGEPLQSEVFTFQTACKPETPFAFAVISDTQGNPKVSGTFAEMAWAQRPHFLLHPGDLVSTGGNNSHWTEHFFPSMHPLISRVPFYPVLGNHEQNARNYFDYMSLPDPEYYYSFKYGNAEFFMVDTNRNVDPASEQYTWLDQALAKSTATWKFVSHHHPPYSSDENDYGNLWKSNKGTRGDLRARQLSTLYDKYNVDMVWNGHIHSYERTWPLKDNKAVTKGGTIYMITGGGGGHLETAGPFRPYFQNNVKHGHHYVMFYVNGSKLEFKAFDVDGKLFDTFAIEKSILRK